MPLDREVYEFPTAIPLKVIGRNEDGFSDFILELFHRHISPDEIQAVSQHESRQNAYLSLTVTFTAQSREHLDAIYAELNGHERVLMVI